MSQPQPIDRRLVGRPPVRPKKRGNWFGRILGLVVLLFLLTLVCVPLYAWGRIDKVDAAPAGKRPADAAGTTYLMVGSDSREGLSTEDKRKLGTGSVGGKRTDTIILLHVPESGPPALISVPRDSWLSVPGKGKEKVNAAYGNGNPKLLIQTLENYTGLRIDHYVEIGFGGFASIIDSVGGVDVCLPKAMKDQKAHINLPAGCQELDGPKALGYVRSRYADRQGDLGRANRQREVIGLVADKAVSWKTFVNPFRYYSIGTSSADALTVDEEMGPVDLAKFALAMRKVAGGGEGVSLTLPIADADARRSGQSVVLLSDSKVKALVQALKEGRTAGLKAG
ncbi:cell envelope-related transcriptional attenuator [Kribbella flavida DSM 17836]|uniref:Cell envelope-related transcriptional attenuator n=1 Tax=Kribbella flavida (strain DSM 17836 / JCM 10339 / NBRC 14399) TaxID=479435 RepID=D2Q2X8_KRIFD|nr:LCP family protein [Kribbella flavida]ADB30309.1 cell envelope-related transcriptional attenuator [Kribbella flavida DSM 17836]